MSSSSDSAGPGLSVVVPVWNDAPGLARLLPALLPLPGLRRIVICDDGSDLPVGPEALGLPDDPRFLWLREPVQRGAGHARNRGLAHVDSPWVLFFDSDDLPLPGLARLLRALAGAPRFDFCLFSHVDSRQRALGHPGPLPSDQQHWDIAAPGPVPALLDPAAAARLARISAYPWNKIYRTAFLRETGIRCTEIPVHNDIELHWRSFLLARDILASSEAGAEHVVAEGGARLTNRTGAERFQVFRALTPVHADLVADAERAGQFADAVADFYLGLFHWIGTTLEPELRPAFRWQAQDFLRRNLGLPLFALIATADPAMARRLNDFLSEVTP